MQHQGRGGNHQKTEPYESSKSTAAALFSRHTQRLHRLQRKRIDASHLFVQELKDGPRELAVLARFAHDAVVPQRHVHEPRVKLARVVAAVRVGFQEAVEDGLAELQVAHVAAAEVEPVPPVAAAQRARAVD